MSTHNPSTASSTPSTEQGPPKTNSARNRSYILLGILVVLLIALWYDYKVARPQVEAAYESVGKKNSEYNALPGKKYLTEKDVQQTLNRQPARFIEEGPYHVEVYSYRSGLPIRSHNYFAVYSAGTPLIFLKHYKYELPMEELKTLIEGAVGGNDRGSSPPNDAEAKKESEQSADAAPVEGKPNPPADVQLNGPTEPPAGEQPTPAAAKEPAGEQPKSNEAPTPPATKPPESGDK